MFDFDAIIERRSFYSTKWQRYQDPQVLPLWVADMDFAVAPAIQSELQQLVQHGVFGYGMQQEALRGTIVTHAKAAYDWSISEEDILWLPGLVFGLNIACRALCANGEAVITATPIYPPFLSAPRHAERGLVTVPLREVVGRWEWDLAAFEQQLQSSATPVRLLLLCNPHNPVGRAWTRAELEQLLELVIRYDLLVCSDEIHCDLILDAERKHIPFATLSAAAAERCVTLMAPSKTYNVAGLNCAFAVASNSQLRHKFKLALRGLSSEINLFGIQACAAAYQYGAEWRLALLDYLRGNLALIEQRLGDSKFLKLTHPEATYLVWIDGRKLCQDYGVKNVAAFFEQAGVGMSDGADFGLDGFVRLNFGTTRSILTTALDRIEAALAALSESHAVIGCI